MKSFRTLFIRAIPAILTSCGIYYFSSLPQPPFVLTSFQWQDKFLHYGAYLFYGVTISMLVDALSDSMKKNIMYLMLWGGFYAFTDEFHQYFVPGRSTELGDWIADIIGIATAAFVYYLYCKNKASISNESHSN